MIEFDPDRVRVKPMSVGKCDVCGEEAFTLRYKMNEGEEGVGVFCGEHAHAALNKWLEHGYA